MKKKIMAAAMLLVSYATNANAQSTATASTSAELVTPISITKVSDMNFGSVAASATAGTVALDYINGRTITGGANVLNGGTLETTAVFTVTGEATNGFSISIPASPITLTGSNSGTLEVSGFTTDTGATGALVTGGAVIKVKAILNVPANAVAGNYINASDLFVTVNYN